MTDRIPKRLGGLSRQGAAGGIGDRAGDDDGQLRRPPRRTPGAPRTAPPWRSSVSNTVSIKIMSTPPAISARVTSEYAATSSSKLMLRNPGSLTSGDSDAVRLVGPKAPATKRGDAAGRAHLVRDLAREARRLQIQLADQRLHAVVRLRHRGGIEGVGGNDIGARVEVGAMNVRDDSRLREAQQIVVAAQIAAPVLESLAAKLLLAANDGAGSSCPWRRRISPDAA